jgi:hypothetical protein
MTVTKTLSLTLLLAVLLSLTGSLTANAQDGAPTQATPRSPEAEADEVADSRATGFRAVDGAQVEDVPGGMMLVGAYGAIAILLLLFLLRQHSQLGDLSTRIDVLRSEIERQRAKDEQA